MSRELLVPLDRRRPVALRRQLESALRDAIRDGRLRSGERLPSTRALAADLDVSRGLVVEAFEQLVAEGYLTGVRGSGTRVAPVAHLASGSPAPPPPPARLEYDFRPGSPDTTLVRGSRLLHHLRVAFDTLDADGFQYGDPAGFLPLRRALAAYLGRVRGVVATAERVVVCSGFAGAVSLLANLLTRRAHDAVAVENPGSPEIHPILRLAGLTPVPVRVDADGLDPQALARTAARAVLVTPAHQFPTGVVLSAERRAALLTWAREVRGLVIEDDYDAEFRYDRVPVGAMQGLAPEHVIYAGSLSKTLAPALRLGWLVLPQQLVAEAIRLRREIDLGNPTLTQAAFASLLESGDYDRHLRRARRLYRSRRDRLVRTLAGSPLRLTVSGAAAGLHLVATLPTSPRPVSEAEILKRGAAHGLRLYGLSQYRIGGGARSPQVLVLGYGSFSERRLAAGLRRLEDVLSATRPPRPGPRSRG